ncbi:MAG: hypothetical protein HYR51_03155 [Candidatus Rokubacteria bacterium]|nr:hypothetical protein [Candidatus Rokubacteria bacterium]
MRSFWLTLLIAGYVSLDVSNPMMPGALTFGVEESVEARQTDRQRGHEDVASLPPVPAPTQLIVERRVRISRTPAPDVSRARQTVVTRSQPHVSTPADAPSEDH